MTSGHRLVPVVPGSDIARLVRNAHRTAAAWFIVLAVLVWSDPRTELMSSVLGPLLLADELILVSLLARSRWGLPVRLAHIRWAVRTSRELEGLDRLGLDLMTGFVLVCAALVSACASGLLALSIEPAWRTPVDWMLFLGLTVTGMAAVVLVETLRTYSVRELAARWRTENREGLARLGYVARRSRDRGAAVLRVAARTAWALLVRSPIGRRYRLAVRLR